MFCFRVRRFDFTTSYRSTLLITTPTTTPSLVKTGLKKLFWEAFRYCSIDVTRSMMSAQPGLDMNGRFPFTKKFRKFRLGCKWNMIFRFVPLENFWKKRNSCKGSPVFPVETSRWKFLFHLQISRLYHQFHAFRGLLSGQASLVVQQIWRLIRVSFLEAFCKQTFRATASAAMF